MAKSIEDNIIRDQLMAEIDESLGKTKDMSVVRRAESDVQYSSGFLSIDYKNGHRVRATTKDNKTVEYDSVGITDGSINMVIGRSGCGKSTWVVQVGANIVRDFDHGLIFIDQLESGMLEDRTIQLTGFDPEVYDKRVKVRNAGITVESVYLQIKAIHDIKLSHEDIYRYDTGLVDSRGRGITKFQPTVYIIDSLPLLMPSRLMDEDELGGQMSTTAQAKALAMLVRRCTQICKEANIIVFAINHITQKLEVNAFTHTKGLTSGLRQNESVPGGVTPLYIANGIFRLDDGTKVTRDKEFGIDGVHVIISNVKSRSGMIGVNSESDVIYNYAIGFDPDLALFIMLKNAGKINGAGAYLYLGDRDDKKFSQKQFKEKLLTDPEFCEIFMEECFKHLYGELSYLEQVAAIKSSTTTKSILDRVRKLNVVE